MNRQSAIKPALLGRMNERQVFQVLRRHGPSSRADVTRLTGISAPTVSKAVAALLGRGLIEESDAPIPVRGRPAKQLRLAAKRAQVLALVIDAEQCSLAAAALDGVIHEDGVVQFATPATYEQLIDRAVEEARPLIDRRGLRTLGLGVSIPGLFDDEQQRSVLSPNLPITNGKSPGGDLQQRLGVQCVVLQESHALAMAERFYGEARHLSDFGIVDIGAGIGLGIVSGGRLLTGRSGLAGEFGHITVDPDGRRCGCGNRGCLETVSSLAALAHVLSEKVGHPLTIAEAVRLTLDGGLDATAEIRRMDEFLAIGLAAVINLLNPSTLFIHSELHRADPALFQSLIELTSRRVLAPTFAACRIVPAQGAKKQGAVAAIIEYLTDSLAPALLANGDATHAAAPPLAAVAD